MSPFNQFVLVAIGVTLAAFPVAYGSLRNVELHGLKNPITTAWFNSMAIATLIAIGLFLVDTNEGQMGFKWVMVCPFFLALIFATSFTIIWWIIDTPDRRKRIRNHNIAKIGGNAHHPISGHH